MKARAAHVLQLALSALLLAWAPPALADVLPDPKRPPWNEEAPPMPRPLPDEDEERSMLLVAAAALAAAAWVVSRHGQLRREGRA